MSNQLNPDDLIDDVAVILLAAGSGERLGSNRPKAFVGLAGEALLVHSLRAFEGHEAVDSIILVVPEDWMGPAEVLIDDVGCDKVTSIEVGGSSRAESVKAGLAAVPNRRATAVLVHDAARPQVPERLIDRVLAPLADGWDAVVPALEVVDTIKVINAKGQVIESPARAQLRAAQTPQACRASELHKALNSINSSELASVTDDAQAVQSVGGKVLCVAGDTRTGKITTADDLKRFEQAMAPASPTAIAAVAVSVDPKLEDADGDDDDWTPDPFAEDTGE